MECFAMEFPGHSLDISIGISKEWSGNSMAKHAIFQVSHYQTEFYT